jgi:hypothetical protein
MLRSCLMSSPRLQHLLPVTTTFKYIIHYYQIYKKLTTSIKYISSQQQLPNMKEHIPNIVQYITSCGQLFSQLCVHQNSSQTNGTHCCNADSSTCIAPAAAIAPTPIADFSTCIAPAAAIASTRMGSQCALIAVYSSVLFQHH